MVAGLTYAQYTTELARLAVVEETNVDYVANLPSAIDWAELAIYRDLDLLSTVSALPSQTLTPNNRALVIPASEGLVTLQQINIITPAGATAGTGSRNPCLPTTKERLDFEWGSATGAAMPTLFAPFNQTQSNDTTVIFGPWPDVGYSVEIIGTIRPASLSSGNTSTWISMNVPDLMLAASMVFISGYQRNFGRAGMMDDPEIAVSWQKQYDRHLATAIAEETRKKFAGPGWTSMSPTPVASPTRG